MVKEAFFMTSKQTADIVRLQREGKGYRAIAAELDQPVNSVKSWCRRHLCEDDKTGFCLQCGTEIHLTPHRRPRKFCSDMCRLTWWKEHPEKRKTKTVYSHICRFCGCSFTNNRIKADYCCRRCFAKARAKVNGDG